jgi:hypothetical protein
MVAWFQNPEYSELYERCQRMGAPVFRSPEEMAEWIRGNFDSEYKVINDILPLLEMLVDLDTPVFRSVLRFLRSIVSRLNLKRRNFLTRALLTPLRLNPKSLHPIGFDTLCIWGV